MSSLQTLKTHDYTGSPFIHSDLVSDSFLPSFFPYVLPPSLSSSLSIFLPTSFPVLLFCFLPRTLCFPLSAPSFFPLFISSFSLSFHPHISELQYVASPLHGLQCLSHPIFLPYLLSSSIILSFISPLHHSLFSSPLLPCSSFIFQSLSPFLSVFILLFSPSHLCFVRENLLITGGVKFRLGGGTKPLGSRRRQID